MDILEGRKKKGTEETIETIMTKNFPKLMQDIQPVSRISENTMQDKCKNKVHLGKMLLKYKKKKKKNKKKTKTKKKFWKKSEVGKIYRIYKGVKIRITSSFSLGASLVAQRVKCLTEMRETGVQSLGWEDSPGEGNGDSGTLAWKIPWMEKPVGYSLR